MKPLYAVIWAIGGLLLILIVLEIRDRLRKQRQIVEEHGRPSRINSKAADQSASSAARIRPSPRMNLDLSSPPRKRFPMPATGGDKLSPPPLGAEGYGGGGGNIASPHAHFTPPPGSPCGINRNSPSALRTTLETYPNWQTAITAVMVGLTAAIVLEAVLTLCQTTVIARRRRSNPGPPVPRMAE